MSLDWMKTWNLKLGLRSRDFITKIAQKDQKVLFQITENYPVRGEADSCGWVGDYCLRWCGLGLITD